MSRRTAGNLPLKDYDILILCGGKGTRLRSLINDRPKPMADIKGVPFLDILIDQLRSWGGRRFILLAGYLGRQIKEYYALRKIDGVEVVPVVEKKRLGTAGAIKNGSGHIKSRRFLVLNGDTYSTMNYGMFVRAYERSGFKAAIAVTRCRGKVSDFGTVETDRAGRISGFTEKGARRGVGGLINAGVYLLDRDILEYIPKAKPVSIEKDVFPALLKEGISIKAYVSRSAMMDIGTPARYCAALKKFTRKAR